MKTALVTGGCGFIGHYLANELDNRGLKVTVMDKAYNFCRNLNKDINFILQDIRMGGISGEYDYVYHLAAKRSVPDSFLHAQDYMSTNVWGTYNIATSFPNARVINISSSAAAGGKSPYGISKKSSEQLFNLHKNSISIRFMNIYGETQPNQGMAVPAFMHALKYNEPAIIYGDGQIVRDFTYILDVVDEVIKIGEDKRKGTTEIGYGTPIKIIELFNIIKKLSKKKTELKFAPPRNGDVKKTCCKYPIKEPKYGFKEGLRRTVRWALKSKEF